MGCNFALLEKLGFDIDNATVLKGYKGDEGRRIGVVAGTADGLVLTAAETRQRVQREFGDFKGEGGWFGFEDEDGEGAGPGVKAVACMNAFHLEEVERVTAAAVEKGFADDVGRCPGVVYLTGAVREEGLKAALEKGMRVVCVGHQICELWGIKYLADRVREMWPGLEVKVVDEEELKVEKTKKNKKNGNDKHKKEDGEGEGRREEEAAEMLKKRKVAEDDSEDGGVAL